MAIALSLANASLRLSANQRRKIKFALMNKIQTKAFSISLGLIILMVSLGVVYLIQANNLATAGYQINGLKNKMTELQGQNQQLELKASELQSMQKISERVNNLGLTQVAYTEYVSPTGSSVAVR